MKIATTATGLGLLLSLGLATACSSKRIKECDDLVATAEQLEKCDQLDAASRADISTATKQIRGALKMLDDVGGADKAPAEQIELLRTNCKSQNEMIRDMYAKAAPDCLK